MRIKLVRDHKPQLYTFDSRQSAHPETDHLMLPGLGMGFEVR